MIVFTKIYEFAFYRSKTIVLRDKYKNCIVIVYLLRRVHDLAIKAKFLDILIDDFNSDIKHRRAIKNSERNLTQRLTSLY